MQGFQLYEHATTVPEKSYLRDDWQGGYQSLKQEYDYWIENIEGEIPHSLQGTLFKMAPVYLKSTDKEFITPSMEMG